MPTDQAKNEFDPRKGERDFQAATAVEMRRARFAAKVLNSIGSVQPQVIQEFFGALSDHAHEEVCARAAVEEDRQ